MRDMCVNFVMRKDVVGEIVMCKVVICNSFLRNVRVGLGVQKV
jgi:hypothetical protein